MRISIVGHILSGKRWGPTPSVLCHKFLPATLPTAPKYPYALELRTESEVNAYFACRAAYRWFLEKVLESPGQVSIVDATARQLLQEGIQGRIYLQD